MPASLLSENLYQIGITGASTSFFSSGLRNTLTNMERGGYHSVLSTLELYSSEWKGHISLPAHYYKERKLLIAGKGPRVVKHLLRQLPSRKKAVEREMKTKHKVYPRYSSIWLQKLDTPKEIVSPAPLNMLAETVDSTTIRPEVVC